MLLDQDRAKKGIRCPTPAGPYRSKLFEVRVAVVSRGHTLAEWGVTTLDKPDQPDRLLLPCVTAMTPARNGVMDAAAWRRVS